MKKKKVDILLSVYNPNLDYLKKQLDSLNCQTYEEIEVIIFDDCIDNRCEISVFEEHLKKLKWRLLPYEDKNLGYIKAFEKLVLNSDGDYIAYCDQDDIWLDKKIDECVKELEESGSLLVASNKMVIDAQDDVTCASVHKTSRNACDTWKSKENIGKYNLFITYAVGMSIVLEGTFARSIVPFSIYVGHDNWSILCACAQGYVSYIEEPLVKYRRHDHNVSGVLKGINTKEDYMRERVIPHGNLISDFKKKYPESPDIFELEEFNDARLNHQIFKIFKYRYLSKNVAMFDIVVAIIPKCLFKTFVKMVQKISN